MSIRSRAALRAVFRLSNSSIRLDTLSSHLYLALLPPDTLLCVLRAFDRDLDHLRITLSSGVIAILFAILRLLSSSPQWLTSLVILISAFLFIAWAQSAQVTAPGLMA
jgi:hypothetical protein